MQARLVAVALVSLILAAGAGAAATPLTNYPVTRGGFALALPVTWIDVTSTTPEPNAKGKVPTMEQIAKAASEDGTKKLVVVDPSQGGKVYIEVDVERIGPVSTKSAAMDTLTALRHAMGSKGTATAAPASIEAGAAYAIHFVYDDSSRFVESDEYLLVHDQIEYSILEVTPKAQWAKYASQFAKSARSFKLLAPPKLNDIVLSNAQVGAGYKGSMIPGGNSVIGQNEVTLDLCDGTYPSESLRTGRLQLQYLRKGKKKSASVSNEVVTYVSGGAEEALREVRSVAQSCARKPITVTQGDEKSTVSVKPISDSKLLSGAVAVRITVQETDGKTHTTTQGIAIYQVKNNTLSGVYAWATPGATLTQAERIGLHAAEESARNLGGSVLTA